MGKFSFSGGYGGGGGGSWGATSPESPKAVDDTSTHNEVVLEECTPIYDELVEITYIHSDDPDFEGNSKHPTEGNK